MAFVVEVLHGREWKNAADERREPIARSFRTRTNAYTAASRVGLEPRLENELWRVRELDRVDSGW